MLTRTVLAASAAALLASATGLSAAAASTHIRPAHPAAAPAAVKPCAESALTVKATSSGRDHVLRLSVKNHSSRACLVDRVPLVTYGDLDGAAVPFPLSGSSAYTLGAGKTAHADVRSLSASGDSDARSVGYIEVAANPEHHGKKFTAASLSEPGGLRVWAPVTTLWQPTRNLADEALAESDGAGVLKV
ncbi:DUF4232 domain-containing protein [Streptomyces sp. NBC_01280]|uniref:DUF4232 domain-containing protein n=1 Tax=unclassified Streptomyces TaxID=2593676 RepID=UPI0022544A72|nr:MULTISPECIES: DUF4232 domain-containing protein [unclassified Streptomyces]MCX5435163.1 DUF4232 domain-containing protein [Streptomyces sp. NBC_00063]WSE12996.1 DUF4232 domain-containing protein [Streptomyces sp. NBC_01397]WUB98058.1 DUF4232 domain-containing protein [Streptomyces sp. NBC_00569]